MTDNAVTSLLNAVRSGVDGAEARLYDEVYDRLKAIAHRAMAQEHEERSLQTTALVHEAYVRMTGAASHDFENSVHFFGAAAEAMRRILIDRARKRCALKRGGDRKRVRLEDNAAQLDHHPEAIDPADLLDIDDVLQRLEQQEPRLAMVIKYRFFLELTVNETAKLLSVSPRTVDTDWHFAKAWIRRELDGETD